MFKTAITYHYAVATRKFVKSAREGLALVITITFLICVVEDVGVIGTNAVANENISNEFQNRGLSDTSLPNKKDSVSKSCILAFDDTPFERRHVAGDTVRTH